MSARYKNVLEEMLPWKPNEKKLYLASRAGNVEEVKRLVYDHVVNVNFNMGRYKFPPLIEASSKDYHEIIHILIKAGAVISSDSLAGLIWIEEFPRLTGLCCSYLRPKQHLKSKKNKKNKIRSLKSKSTKPNCQTTRDAL